MKFLCCASLASRRAGQTAERAQSPYSRAYGVHCRFGSETKGFGCMTPRAILRLTAWVTAGFTSLEWSSPTVVGFRHTAYQ